MSHQLWHYDADTKRRESIPSLRLKNAGAGTSAAVETRMMMPDNLHALGALGNTYAADSWIRLTRPSSAWSCWQAQMWIGSIGLPVIKQQRELASCGSLYE
jgi:hypothetical protein